MTPLDSASRLAKFSPEDLYYLLVWATSARDDPKHEAELAQIEEMAYSKTADCEQHRDSYRRSQLVHEVISDS